ncbi:type IV secretion protein Dot [Legionella sp. km535]|uniref:type IV secretion protein Dot n=1 Tax=Legionella sp. km535 TaxID=2498107 RepID=UPI000F8EFFBB|nr:type IV secretion protein Dot [Legionella sp. km535]RUR18500.1 type IV secretion protein Dot [Legionella sp. km535]
MTLVLKDFEHLKSHFNDCVAFVLLREKKNEIANLPPRRRDELQFLSTLIQELDTLITQAKATEKRAVTARSVNTLYAAMNVIIADIDRSKSAYESSGKVKDRLNIAMGITAEHQPSAEQYVMFYKSFNQFMKQIYVENDSRNGFKKGHIFQTVPMDKLVKFTKIGFEFEEAEQNNVNSSLVAGETTKADGAWYKPLREASGSIVAPFKSYADLANELHKLILTETADKNAADISSLDENRALQLQFLKSLEQSLSSPKASGIKDAEKTAILAGAMYLIRGFIAVEYGHEPLSHKDITATLLRNGSVVHTELTRILNAKATAVEDIEVLVTAANQYIRHMTVQTADAKESIKPAHIFTSIENFPLIPMLSMAQNIVRSCRDKAIDLCAIQLNKEIEAAKPKEASSSYSSTIYSWWKKTPKVPEEEEELDAQHEETSNAACSSSSSSSGTSQLSI